MDEESDDVVSAWSDTCGGGSSRQRSYHDDTGPCYELFLRAVSHTRDAAAWQAIMTQYRHLVLRWLGPHANEDNLQEVFLRFWRAQRGHPTQFTDRFPNIGAVMGYLKQCAVTVRIESRRTEIRQQHLLEQLRGAAVLTLLVEGYHDDEKLKSVILAQLKGEKERVLFEEIYRYSLSPRGVQSRHPELFPTRQMVYRAKENLLKRLRRNERLRELWEFPR